jgi:16S rRNA (cytosine967-C5)-methyltransferase
VYATCSLLAAENEDVVAEFAQGRGADFEPLAVSSVLAAAHVEDPEALVRGAHLRLWPHLHQTDGFFAAAWKKR